MVTHLPRPAGCSLELTDRVVADRQNGVNKHFFNGLALEWRDRVQAYIQHGGCPIAVPTWPAIATVADGDKFRNLYLSPKEGQAQTEIIDNLRNGHRLNNCPACGEMGRPNTLDHYLPKADYPHFSITPENLFPMCTKCQGEKDVTILAHDGTRAFVHPYFDAFIVNQVVMLEITPPFNTPAHRLYARLDLPPDQKRLVENHISELGLHQRFSHFFGERHLNLLHLIAEVREEGDDVRAVISLFKREAKFRGSNAWEHVFYAGVMANDALMAHLETGDLPECI